MKTLRWLRNEWFQILLLALPFAVAAAWWNKIPPMVVSHWNIHNQPDGWMAKGLGLLLLPVGNIGIAALLFFVPLIDPRLRRHPDTYTLRQHRLWRLYRYALTAFFTAIALALIVIAAGWPLDMGRVCCNAAFVLFAAMGNFLGNLEPNYLLGIRTPWTLEDPGTWRATHRLGGRLMTLGAVALLAVGFFVSDMTQVILLLAFALGLGAWSIGYSAWFFQRRRQTA